MSEDRFFQQVNATMADYRPEVPESVYTGMRRKLWWSNFTRLSVTRFNVWYLTILLVGASIGLSYMSASVQTISESDSFSQPINSGAEQNSQTTEITNTATDVMVTDKTQVQPGEQRIHSAGRQHSDQVATVQEAPKSVEVESQSATAAISEDPKEANQNSQPVAAPAESKQGSKKGLKVKTYNSTEKKD